MVEKQLKRMPVVDAEGKLIGILGRLDILNTIAAVHLPEWHPEARPIGAQATVERRDDARSSSGSRVRLRG